MLSGQMNHKTVSIARLGWRPAGVKLNRAAFVQRTSVVLAAVDADRQKLQELMIARAARKSTRILPLLSELTAIQSLNTKFEELAGRSAMLGFAAAAVTETVLPQHGLFGEWHQAAMFCSFGLVLVLVSALAAASSNQRLGMQLLEAVTASLTSQRRSATSVAKTNVDSALDSAFDGVFDNEFLGRTFLIVDDRDVAQQ